MVQLLLLKGADKDAHVDQEMDNTTHRAVYYMATWLPTHLS